MIEQLEESELREITRLNGKVALAQCIEGLGCSVYADGEPLPPWASYRAEELTESHVREGAVITNQSAPRYFVLSWDKDMEELTLPRGPLSADELRQVSTLKK